ncbi:hypothetical protein GpartN1_g6858.t1 [Galdieria partita]|uniref:Uncharacterized protein n=1 Tax=Galdieria partita TaxID=83374 RepID=A0A9C7UTW9_9RHOD|nr:hypothetical protein GpartN1_g6858.t1 [Galdieria partita]
MQFLWQSVKTQLQQHLELGNISIDSLEEETAPFPLFLQVVATLLDEWSYLSSRTQLYLPHWRNFHYDINKPLAELEQECLQHVAWLMDIPVNDIDWKNTVTRLQVLHFIATELEACKLAMADKENISKQPQDILCTTKEGSNHQMTFYLDQLSVLLKKQLIEEASQARTLIRHAKERILDILSVPITTHILQEYLSNPNNQKKIQEMNHILYLDYRNRRKLLITRFQATLECFQSSERWTSCPSKDELVMERMFCVYDLYVMTREDWEFMEMKQEHHMCFQVPFRRNK